MSLAEGTRVVGRVEGTQPNENRAWIAPLYRQVGHDWQPSGGSDDYPTNGQVFWSRAHNVQERSVWFFELEHNPGSGKDRFLVHNPRQADAVLDFRDQGEVEQIARLVSCPVPARSDFEAGQVFLWCTGNMILGPFTATVEGDRATFRAAQPERVSYRSAGNRVVLLADGTVCGDDLLRSSIVGHVDCRSDQDVLYHALRHAAKIGGADASAPSYDTSKKALKEAARQLRFGENTAERELDAQRLRRALDICEDSATVRALAQQLTEQVLTHPQVVEHLERKQARVEEEVRAEAKAEASILARREIDLVFASQRTALEEAQAQTVRARAELEQIQAEARTAEHRRAQLHGEIAAAEHELAEAAGHADEQLRELEDSVRDKVNDLLQGASGALAQSVVLRALGAGNSHTPEPISRTGAQPPLPRVYEPFPESLSDPASVAGGSLRRHLSSTARAWGLSHLVLERVHASVRAGLVPVLTGNGGMTALRAYASAVFARRLTVLPVAHDFLHPVDLLGVQASEPSVRRPHHGLLEAALEATKGQRGILVLESFNRAPTESYLLPWLQNQPRQIDVPSRDAVELHAGLCVAATTAAGATTAPLSPDIWGHAVSIDVPRYPRLGSIPDTVELVELTPLPDDAIREAKAQLTDLVDGLDVQWPIDPGVMATAHRFAAGLAEIQSAEETAVSVVACVLLPTLATVLSGNDLAAASEEIIGRLDDLDDGHGRTLRSLSLRLHGRFA